MNHIGLTSQQAREKLKIYGQNTIHINKESILSKLIKTLLNAFNLLLLASAIISLITGSAADFLIIIVILLVNIAIDYFHEFTASRVVEKFEKYISSSVNVYRDGELITLDRMQIVPEDLIQIKLGDIIPADCYVVETDHLIVDESTLTGESSPVEKSTEKKNNEVYSGTVVVKGEAICKVYATGAKSKFGSISNLASNSRKKTSYEIAMTELIREILKVSAVLLTIILIGILIFNNEITGAELILFALALATTIIPEALPVILNLSLSNGALKLSKNGVLVKRLTSLEDLGNLEVICSDKTGTLTYNELTVKKVIAEKDILSYLNLSSLNSNDPFDKALHNYVESQKFEELSWNLIQEEPFDPSTKISSRTFQDSSSDSKIEIIKGAPENIIKELFKNDVGMLNEINKISAENGYRVVSIVLKKSNEVEYLGTVFFEDKIREDAKEIIKNAQNLKVQVKIITGDSYEVAKNVGLQIGMIDNENQILNVDGVEIQNLGDEIYNYHIFCRANPEQKFEIIKRFEMKFITGYIGDGINDAPSLKIANVSFAVDSATEIAKASADIILLNKSLAPVIDGIKIGRKAFINVNKYLMQTFSGNFGNFATIGFISIFSNFLPMLPIQILLSNLLVDLAILAIPFDNVEKTELKQPQSHDPQNIIRLAFKAGLISSVFDFLFFYIFRNDAIFIVQTKWFFFSVIEENLTIISIRTKHIFFRSKPAKILLVTMLISTIITFAIVLIGVTDISVKLDLTALIPIFLILALYFIVNELLKFKLKSSHKL